MTRQQQARTDEPTFMALLSVPPFQSSTNLQQETAVGNTAATVFRGTSGLRRGGRDKLLLALNSLRKLFHTVVNGERSCDQVTTARRPIRSEPAPAFCSASGSLLVVSSPKEKRIIVLCGTASVAPPGSSVYCRLCDQAAGMECETSFGYAVYSSSSKAHKRKKYENGSSACKEDAKEPAKTRVTCFIQMLPNKGIFQSEKWKPNGSTLYYPVSSHLLVNFERYDQISFDEGLFFIGDDSGGCVQKEQGHVIHCWRFDDKEKTLFIAMSYLFTDFSTFQEVVGELN